LNIFGLYKAIVIDNSKFFERGTITVRLPPFYMKEMQWDLTTNFPDFIKEGELENPIDDRHSYDMEAKVFASFGGGRNYGGFILPQINEVGIVAFLRGNKNDPIWMGSIFEVQRSDPKGEKKDFEPKYVNIPSDDPTLEGINSDGSKGKVAQMDADSGETELEKNFIFRTKTTKYDESDEGKGLNWEKVNTSNIISVGQNQIRIRHYNKDDGWSEPEDEESPVYHPQKWQEIVIKKENEKQVILIENVNIDKLENGAETDSKRQTLKIYCDSGNEDKETISLGVNSMVDTKDDSSGNLSITYDNFKVEMKTFTNGEETKLATLSVNPEGFVIESENTEKKIKKSIVASSNGEEKLEVKIENKETGNKGSMTLGEKNFDVMIDAEGKKSFISAEGGEALLSADKIRLSAKEQITVGPGGEGIVTCATPGPIVCQDGHILTVSTKTYG
jgi:hypothetical protein